MNVSPEEMSIVGDILAALKSMSPEEQMVYLAANLGRIRVDVAEVKDTSKYCKTEISKIKWTAAGISAAIGFLMTLAGVIINVVW